MIFCNIPDTKGAREKEGGRSIKIYKYMYVIYGDYIYMYMYVCVCIYMYEHREIHRYRYIDDIDI